jgi:ATP-dependent Lhr-like helicase
MSLLRQLGLKEIIFQDATGLILLAPKGERISEHYSFYAAFSSEEEFRIVASGQTLGSMPISRPLVPGSFLIFGGRRWQVISISQEELVIEVRPGSGGMLPSFEGGSGAVIHDRVRDEMRSVLRTDEPIVFLDKMALRFLQEARDTYKRLDLDETLIRQAGNQTQLLLWKGDRIQDTLLLMLQAIGFKGLNEGICISLTDTAPEAVIAALEEFLLDRPIDAIQLAATVQTKIRQKWDSLLPDDLLNASFASENLDVIGALAAARLVVGRGP